MLLKIWVGITFRVLGQNGTEVSRSTITILVPGDDPEVVLLPGQQALDVTLAGRSFNGLPEEFHLCILSQHFVTYDITATRVQGVRPS